jgi:SPP1 gp7 family putative phage head morphogenesis protein
MGCVTNQARILQMALKARKRKKLPRWPLQKQPKTIERNYQRALVEVLTFVNNEIHAHLLPRLKSIGDNYYKHHPFAQKQNKKDEVDDDIDELINGIRVKFAEKYSDEELKEIANKYGLSVSDFNRSGIIEGLQKVAGIDIFLDEPWLADQLSLFASSNANLIGGLVDTELDKVYSTILGGFQSGSRVEEIADNIKDIIDPEDSTSRSRADFIARDQISKLNGNLNQLRQTDLGIEQYIWRTSLDERVRESHQVKEGETYRWDDPPADTGNPGEDYQCRCTAEPDLAHLNEDDEDADSSDDLFSEEEA